MTTNQQHLVAWMAAGTVACVEPFDPDLEIAARFSPDQCTVVNPGPGIDDGMVGICHATCAEDRYDHVGVTYEYVRVTPAACRNGHAEHELDFRSDDPLCRVLPTAVTSAEPLTDTVLAW